MTQKEVVKKVYEILEPVLPEKGLSLWDVEMVKEGKNLYLRVYIDKPDDAPNPDGTKNGIGIDDCEFVSRYLSTKLDELDPIEAPYMLEVSSPGINRALKKDSDYMRYIGHKVDIKLFKPHQTKNTKTFEEVTLKSYTNETVTISIDTEEYSFDKKDIASCRLTVIF